MLSVVLHISRCKSNGVLFLNIYSRFSVDEILTKVGPSLWDWKVLTTKYSVRSFEVDTLDMRASIDIAYTSQPFHEIFKIQMPRRIRSRTLRLIRNFLNSNAFKLSRLSLTLSFCRGSSRFNYLMNMFLSIAYDFTTGQIRNKTRVLFPKTFRLCRSFENRFEIRFLETENFVKIALCWFLTS